MLWFYSHWYGSTCSSQGEWAEYAPELVWMIKKMNVLSGVVCCSSWYPVGPISRFRNILQCTSETQETCFQALSPSKRLFCLPVSPARMWSGCKGLIDLLLASLTATLKQDSRRPKAFQTWQRNPFFIFEK